MTLMKTIILIEKGVVFIIYAIAASLALWKVRCGLHLAAMVTIAAFLICLSGTFLVYLFDMYNVIANVNRLVYMILDIVCNGVMLAILYYYTYEIRVVLLKV